MRKLTNSVCCSDGGSALPSKCQIFVAKGIVVKNKELGVNLPAIVVRHEGVTYYAVDVVINGNVTIKQREVPPNEKDTVGGPLVWIEADWPVEMRQAFDASKT